jgi:hypothetical protein
MMSFFLREKIESLLHEDNPPKKGIFYFPCYYMKVCSTYERVNNKSNHGLPK